MVQRNVVEIEKLPVVIELSGAQTLDNHLERFRVALARFHRVQTEPLVLHVAYTAADPRLEASS